MKSNRKKKKTETKNKWIMNKLKKSTSQCDTKSSKKNPHQKRRKTQVLKNKKHQKRAPLKRKEWQTSANPKQTMCATSAAKATCVPAWTNTSRKSVRCSSLASSANKLWRSVACPSTISRNARRISCSSSATCANWPC